MFPAGDWQTRCLWQEVAQSRFHVDFKSNFVLKNNSMEFLPGQITQRINVLYKSQLKRTWHHSKSALRGKVAFALQTQSGTPSCKYISIHDGAVNMTDLQWLLNYIGKSAFADSSYIMADSRSRRDVTRSNPPCCSRVSSHPGITCEQPISAAPVMHGCIPASGGL